MTLTHRRVGARIQGRRSDAGLTQTDLASDMAAAGHVCWSQMTVSKAEHGIRRVTLVEAVALTHILGRDLWDGMLP